ncbi:FIT family protein scs3 [Penicillium subrubescens]|uniref:Acyl-coenzyme A diphosphatase SCS3 n=2 Tax=Penicillium subrubescens TaxID=1316194 RepID=A0A1Q5T0Q9_9EURO|nr:FIT family protein scs3 [Penicillium subrubescens]
MATPTRPAPSPAALLIYPATLLLGSLFSVISPVARATRESSLRLPKSAAPLAPSLAADLHLSENPVNYFARKNNIFNLYFVKIGWLWTTVAFVSLLLFQPVYRASSSLSQAQQQTRVRRALQAFLRYAIATTIWYLMTQWFFGPAIIDRSFVVTGGKCEEVMERAGKMELGGSPSAQVETLFSAAACKAAGGAWRGGHDISGHVFMLVLATAFLAHEAVGAGAFSAFSAPTRADGDSARERKASGPVVSGLMNDETDSGLARKWSLRLVWGVVGLGWWMLFMTAIWFHTWLEKWSGLIVALTSVYVIYILPRRLTPWRDIVGVPGL